MEKINAFTAIFSTISLFVIIMIVGYFVNKRYSGTKENNHLFNSGDIDRRRMADPGNPFSPFYDGRDHPG